jgi:ParB-like chromosome segregation protein Spo0J
VKKIKSSIQRIQAIESYLEDAEHDGKKLGTKNVQLRDGVSPRTIIALPSENLMYRIQNTRTRRQQLKYLRERPSLPKDLFADPESQRAQEAQEAILLEMIDSTGQDFVSDLDGRGQEDPAIITIDGYIVNGNRRTAALRRLGKEYMSCVVLPKNVTKKEIYDLEIDLQMSKDFREKYHWVNELIDIEEGINNFSETPDDLASRLRIKKPELTSKLRMKKLVDKFLNWKMIPGQYDYEKLDEAEQDFSELEKETRKAKYAAVPGMLDQLEKAVFNIVDSKPEQGRSYAIERDLFKNFEPIYEEMKKELGKSKPASKKVSDVSKEKNTLLETIAAQDQVGEIVDVFGDPSNSQEVSKLLQNTIKDVTAKNTEIKGAEAAFDAVSEALRKLQPLKIDNTTAKIEGISNKLAEIINVSTDLLKQARKQKK